MILEDFKKQIDVLSEAESNMLRNLFIARFINTGNENYKNYIANRELFSDGYCYTGYLWDNLLDFSRITMKSLIEELTDKQEVLVLWDIHSCDRIFIENYWKFPKHNVIRVDGKWLIQGFEHLPEDIYIFDYDLSWIYILTHENDGKRKICMKVV